MGTWRNLLLSMAALGAVVALWLAMVPRVERVDQPAIDVGRTTRQLARDTGTPLQLPAFFGRLEVHRAFELRSPRPD